MDKYWDSEEMFLDGDHYFDQMINDIDQAKKMITVEVYIFNNDSLGKEVASHLIQANQRGVKVQIIVDGIGSYDFFNQLYHVFLAAGIQVKIYNPLPLLHPFRGKLNIKKKIQIFFSRLWSINKRNHRKIITIDSYIMYTGSFNFTSEHTKYHSSKKWKDMGAKVTGENVKLAVLHFKKIWRLRDFFKYRKEIKYLLGKRNKFSPLRLNHSLFMKRYYNRDFLKRIDEAQNRIWLMTPYFIPRRKLIRALAKAAQNGIDVRILISLKSDVKIFQSLQYFYYPFLLAKGIKIFLYEETILHAKNFIIDDWTTVGSSNLNHRSFLHDLEVDLCILDENNKAIIEDNFTQCLSLENELKIEDLKQRSLFDKFLSRLLFLFKYWF